MGAELSWGTGVPERPAMDPDLTTGADEKVRERVDAADSVLHTLHDPRQAVLALGSNLGHRLDTLQGAVDALEDTPGVRVRRISAVYETEPVGGPGGQGSYLNAVVLVATTLGVRSLLERANAIEEAFGRVRAERWGPRTLDIDIIGYQGVTSDEPALTLPHPRAHERAFVLAPWLDVDGDAELPGHGRVADLLAGLGTAGVVRRDDHELRLPE